MDTREHWRRRARQLAHGPVGRWWRRTTRCPMGEHSRCRDLGVLDGRDPDGWLWCLDCGHAATQAAGLRLEHQGLRRVAVAQDGSRWQLEL